MDLRDALTLSKRLGVNAPSLSARAFSLAYYRRRLADRQRTENPPLHSLPPICRSARS